MTEDISLKDTVRLLAEQLQEQNKLVKEKKIKKWRMPFRSFLSKRRVRKGWVSIIYLRSNGAANFMRAPIDENIVDINGTLHVVDPRYIISYKNKPIIILPEWSMYPLDLKEKYSETELQGLKSMGTRHVYNYMKRNLIKEKKPMRMGMMLFILVLIAGGVYYMYKSGMFS